MTAWRQLEAKRRIPVILKVHEDDILRFADEPFVIAAPQFDVVGASSRSRTSWIVARSCLALTGFAR